MKQTATSIACLVCLIFSGLFSPLVSISHGRNSGKDLPEELKQIQIGDKPLPPQTPDVGVVTSLMGTGRLVILNKKQKAGHYGREKDPVFEESALFSLKDCRSRIEFRDKSVAMLAPESRLDIGEVSMSILKGEKNASFELMKGKALFYAIPLFGYKDMKFDVKTPTAMIGVRGTKFGVEVEEISGGRSERGGTRLASLQPLLAQTTQTSDNVVTRIFVLEGSVEVTSLVDGRKQVVGENEVLEADRAGLGVLRSDPARIRAFLEDVAGGTEGVSLPGRTPQMMEQRFLRDEAERLDRIEDMKQREIMPPVSPHSDYSK